MGLSVGQIKNLVGSPLIKKLEEQFGLHTSEKILRGFAEEKKPTLRINTLKAATSEIMDYLRSNGVQFEKLHFPTNALVIKNKNEKFFEKLEIYQQGKIYFQNLSSQLPAIILEPQPGENVLDLCAAPGSKTTQIAALMQNKGEILANEIDQIRFEKLKYNLEKQGVKIAEVSCKNGMNLGEEYPEQFDRVLLDTPCSAEGRISMREQRTYKFWSQKVVDQNAKLQKRLISSAFKALRPGGVLVYSTCSLMMEENEEVVKFALENSGGKLRLEKIKVPINNQLDRGFGVTVLPDKLWEGFFVAKLRKA